MSFMSELWISLEPEVIDWLVEERGWTEERAERFVHSGNPTACKLMDQAISDYWADQIDRARDMRKYGD